MKVIVSLLVVVSAIWFAACVTTAAPTLYSSKVKVVSSNQVNDCSFVGTVASRFGGNFVSMEQNITNVSIDLRNKAGELGATHLVLHQIQQTDAAPWGGSRCNNCVMRSGDAYLCTNK